MHVLEAYRAVQPACALAPILFGRDRGEEHRIFAAARHRQLPKTPPAARAITVDLDDGRDIKMHGEAPGSAAEKSEQGGPSDQPLAEVPSTLPERIAREASSLGARGAVQSRLGQAAAVHAVV